MIEKIEIVHGDDARRAPARNHQRVSGVHDVDGSGEHFNRRPLQTVPEEVQHPHGHAAVDDARAKAGGGIGGRAVAPGARERRDVIVVRRCVGPDNFVHVLADTSARAQRGTVIDKNLHGSMR